MNNEIISQATDGKDAKGGSDLDQFSHCAQCGNQIASIKGDSHNYCQNCGFRDSCC